jgi:hypothetical protein
MKVVLIILVGAVGMITTPVRAAFAAEMPHVAVFSQPLFPAYNVPSIVSPKKIVAALNRVGVSADALDTDALADSSRLNVRNYAAVVLPYGNVYPEDAFENLKAFHKAGGSFIMSGVPFTHPVRSDS